MNKEQKVIEKAKALVKVFYSTQKPVPTFGEEMYYLKEAIEALDAPELITMDGEYQYRNGEPARVLCVDRANKRLPVVSMDEEGAIRSHDEEGCRNGNPQYDLIPIKRKLRGLEVDSHIQRVVDYDYY